LDDFMINHQQPTVHGVFSSYSMHHHDDQETEDRRSTWRVVDAAVDSMHDKEADHGLRADGGVGGPSLAERVAMGTAVVSTAPVSHATPVLSSSQDLYLKRNAMVSAAGKAGKSRWGDMEIQRAVE
jgi:hypothetical protein